MPKMWLILWPSRSDTGSAYYVQWSKPTVIGHPKAVWSCCWLIICCPQRPQELLSASFFLSFFTPSLLQFSPTAALTVSYRNYKPFKTVLHASSWVPKTDHISPYIILLLSTGCPFIHEYSTNSLLCAKTASTRPLLADWTQNLQTNPPATIFF